MLDIHLHYKPLKMSTRNICFFFFDLQAIKHDYIFACKSSNPLKCNALTTDKCFLHLLL